MRTKQLTMMVDRAASYISADILNNREFDTVDKFSLQLILL